MAADKFSGLGTGGTNWNDRFDRGCRGSGEGNTSNGKVSGRGNGQGEVAMEAAAGIGVDRHGIGIELTLQGKKRGMVGRGGGGGKGSEGREWEIRRNSGRRKGGHGGAQ